LAHVAQGMKRGTAAQGGEALQQRGGEIEHG
jgi:hypothetical protein